MTKKAGADYTHRYTIGKIVENCAWSRISVTMVISSVKWTVR